jgi:hypothetical protein
MNCNLSNISFIKVGKEDDTYRYIDILQIIDKKDVVIEPYAFTYDYIQKERSMFYSLPIEGFNNNEALNPLRLVYPTLNKNKLLTKTNYFLPQLSDDQSQNINAIASSVSYEDLVNQTVNSNIFALIEPGESWFELYETSLDIDDPYGELNSDNVTMINDRQYLDFKNFLRSMVIGVTNDPTTWTYTQSVTSQVTKPVKWLVDQLEYDLQRIPSYKRLKEKNLGLVESLSDKLIIGNRTINSVQQELPEKEESETKTYIDPF